MKTQDSQAALTKMLTGISGFDEISGGGLPRGRTTLVMGGPGCGKTVFALQTLANGARHMQEPGVFVAFEENTRQIIANAATFGWDLAALKKRKLFFLDAQLSPDVVRAGDFDLTGMLSILEAKTHELGAKRIVFDGIDVLVSLLDNPAKQRREIYRIRDWLANMGLTGIITKKLGAEGDPHSGYLQFMADCVVVLRHQVVEGAAFRNLSVMKYRGSGFSDDEFPISLSDQGLQLTNRGPSELAYEVSDERISSGLPRLDKMLCGGYHRGSNVLVSGAPGTAKSTLAGLFAAASCERGERTLYVSFDEGANQIVRNLRSVGVRLAPYVKSGLLSMYSTRTRGPNVEDQFATLRARVRAHRPRCMVLDPLSALSSKLSHLASADTTQQFLDFLRRERITVVNTSLMEGIKTSEETAAGISTAADTWIHLSYVVQDGERNRALTIVKSRGTGHSNQVRELTLSNEGVNLTDVFMAGGRALMGVARWEWEQDELAARQRMQAETELKRLQLQVAQAEAVARLQVIQAEIDARNAEMAVLALATGSAIKRVAADRVVLRRMRHGDKEPSVFAPPPAAGGGGLARKNGQGRAH